MLPDIRRHLRFVGLLFASSKIRTAAFAVIAPRNSRSSSLSLRHRIALSADELPSLVGEKPSTSPVTEQPAHEPLVDFASFAVVRSNWFALQRSVGHSSPCSSFPSTFPFLATPSFDRHAPCRPLGTCHRPLSPCPSNPCPLSSCRPGPCLRGFEQMTSSTRVPRRLPLQQRSTLTANFSEQSGRHA